MHAFNRELRRSLLYPTTGLSQCTGNVLAQFVEAQLIHNSINFLFVEFANGFRNIIVIASVCVPISDFSITCNTAYIHVYLSVRLTDSLGYLKVTQASSQDHLTLQPTYCTLGQVEHNHQGILIFSELNSGYCVLIFSASSEVAFRHHRSPVWYSSFTAIEYKLRNWNRRYSERRSALSPLSSMYNSWKAPAKSPAIPNKPSPISSK